MLTIELKFRSQIAPEMRDQEYHSTFFFLWKPLLRQLDEEDRSTDFITDGSDDDLGA